MNFYCASYICFYRDSLICLRQSNERHPNIMKGAEAIECFVADDLKAGVERAVVTSEVTTVAPLLSVVVKVIVATDVTTTLTNEDENEIPEFPGAAVISAVITPVAATPADVETPTSVCTGVSK
jgi:hypothetical protein